MKFALQFLYFAFLVLYPMQYFGYPYGPDNAQILILIDGFLNFYEIFYWFSFAVVLILVAAMMGAIVLIEHKKQAGEKIQDEDFAGILGKRDSIEEEMRGATYRIFLGSRLVAMFFTGTIGDWSLFTIFLLVTLGVFILHVEVDMFLEKADNFNKKVSIGE